MANNVLNKYIVFISHKLENKFSKDLSFNKDVHIPLVELFLENNLRGFITEFCVVNNISRNSTSYKLVSNLTSRDLIDSLEKPGVVEALKLPIIIIDYKLDLSVRIRSDIHVIKNVCIWTTGRAPYNYPINFEGERTITEVFYYIRTFPSAENFYVFSYLLGSTDKMPDFMIGHKHEQSKSSQEIFSYYLKGEIFPLCPFCFNLIKLDGQFSLAADFSDPIICTNCFTELAEYPFYASQEYVINIINFSSHMIFLDGPEDNLPELKLLLYNLYLKFQNNYFDFE